MLLGPPVGLAKHIRLVRIRLSVSALVNTPRFFVSWSLKKLVVGIGGFVLSRGGIEQEYVVAIMRKAKENRNTTTLSCIAVLRDDLDKKLLWTHRKYCSFFSTAEELCSLSPSMTFGTDYRESQKGY